ncbi:actin binding Rho activating protein b [Myripristis murdjan]|uniref:actin binding Rho activating protein b n=1 Tax=Myripristis murdjan TaxID=586833 RepID=UPI001175FD80|nr:actin-binding Rho-activating protein-like [Myripristis murdjan]
MSETTKATPRKPSTNKNIKKLRTISMVCSLAHSWQQWVTDNETKQASEPSGWAPSSLDKPTEVPDKKWVPKKTLHAKNALPNQTQPTEPSQNHIAGVGESQKISAPHQEIQGSSPSDVKVETTVPLVESRIKTKQVVKTVTSGVQEKSAGIGFLTEKITKEALPSAEEIDKMLSKRSSPTRRRKCSNMVSSLTKSWKQVEKERKFATEGGDLGKGRTCGMDREVSGHLVDEKKSLETEDGQTHKVGPSKEAENKESPEEEEEEEEEESAVKIKRPSFGTHKKEAVDAHKISTLSKKYSAVGNLKNRWQNFALEHTINQKLNPFSEEFDYEYSMSLRLQKGEEGYGRPKEGSKTAERAKRAEQHIHREIDDMCFVIRTMADPDPDGKTRVTFAQLFDRYVRISDKVVGILMRARKHGKVAFEGEMLWQGRDDEVVITLLV